MPLYSMPGRDPRLQKRINEIEKKRKELHNQRVDWIIQKTKTHTEYPLDILAILHEKQALNQMKKHAYNITENYELDKATEKFWVNQQKFLEFMNIENTGIATEPHNPGYLHSHSHFLDKNPSYRDNLLTLTSKELYSLRKHYWEQYNELVEDIHKIVPKYESIESILIKLE